MAVKLFSLEEQDALDTPVDPIELQKQYEEVKELDKELTEDEATLSEGLEAFRTLNRLESLLINTKGKELSPISQEAFDVALGSICNHLGVKKEVVVRKYSLESHNLSKSDIALESVGDFIKDVWEKIKKFFAKLWEGIKAFFDKLASFFKSNKKDLEEKDKKLEVLLKLEAKDKKKDTEDTSNKKDSSELKSYTDVVLDEEAIEKNKELLLKIMNFQSSPVIELNFNNQYEENVKALVKFKKDYIELFRNMVINKASDLLIDAKDMSYGDFLESVQRLIDEFNSNFPRDVYRFTLNRIYEGDPVHHKVIKFVFDVTVACYIDYNDLEVKFNKNHARDLSVREDEIKVPMSFNIFAVKDSLRSKITVSSVRDTLSSLELTPEKLKKMLNEADTAIKAYEKKAKELDNPEEVAKIRLFVNLFTILQNLIKELMYYTRKVEATRVIEAKLNSRFYDLLITQYEKQVKAS